MWWGLSALKVVMEVGAQRTGPCHCLVCSLLSQVLVLSVIPLHS